SAKEQARAVVGGKPAGEAKTAADAKQTGAAVTTGSKMPAAAEQPTAGAIAAARKLVDEASAAKGKAELIGLKAIRVTEIGTRTFRGQRVPLMLERTFVAPDKVRFELFGSPRKAEPPELVSSSVVSGKVGWHRKRDPKSHKYVVTEATGDDLA